MILSRLVDNFPQGFCTLCCFFQGIIVLLSFDHRRKPSIGGADPTVIPVTDEISPNDSPEFIRDHFFRVIMVIQQFCFHSGPHAFVAGIIMAFSACAVYALLYAILMNYFPVKLTGVLASPVTVDDCSPNTRKRFRCIFQYPHT